MDYESAIRELRERMQALEQEIEILKQAKKNPTIPHRSNSKVTEKMLIACYETGKKAYENGGAKTKRSAEQMAEKIGMNRNNAIMTVYAAYALLSGELYKRTISGKSVELFLSRIESDYGKGGLQKSVAALRLHIDYRRNLNHNVDLLERICDRYQEKIDQ